MVRLLVEEVPCQSEMERGRWIPVREAERVSTVTEFFFVDIIEVPSS
jgi:hypothetical protein